MLPAHQDFDSAVGPRQIIRFWEGLDETFDELQLLPQQYVDAGDRVAVRLRHFGRGKGSGLELDTELYHQVTTFENGTMTRIEYVTTWEEALRLAGVHTDVIVVGGGSAGLQAALTLGRMRFDVVVVDSGQPSNAPAHAIGGLLGAHDVAPLDLLATGRAQLAELPSVRLVEGDVARVNDDLTVTLADGTTLAGRAVVLATGGHYAVPEAPGIAELWGTSVIHCPFCHGWESRDARIGLLAAGEEHAGHVLPMLQRLSADVEVFDEIAAVRAEDGVLRAVVLPDGTEVPRDVLFIAAPPAPRDEAFAHLQLERTDQGLVAIDSFGRTSVAGVYAAGDLVVPAPAVVQALASAQRAAVAVTRDLDAAVVS